MHAGLLRLFEHIAILNRLRDMHCDAINSSMTCKVDYQCTCSSCMPVVAARHAESGSDFEELGAGAAAHSLSWASHCIRLLSLN